MTNAVQSVQGHVRDYHAINDALPAGVKIPKKIATPIRVEAKVWFANERSECWSFGLIGLMSWACLFWDGSVCEVPSWILCADLGRCACDSPLAWISYLNLSILLGSLALALFNASEDAVARNFAIFYALVSGGILMSVHSHLPVILTFNSHLPHTHWYSLPPCYFRPIPSFRCPLLPWLT